MRFWDASAVVPLLIDEQATSRALELVREDDALIVWWGTLVECSAATAHYARRGASPEVVRRMTARLRGLAAAWQQVEPTDRLRAEAVRLTRLHPLRGAAALQLAAALAACDDQPQALDLVSGDRRLIAAATRHGFHVIDPLVTP